jgi:hypothetical protein
MSERRLLIDNWALRGWLLWPLCALRRHREAFWLAVRWNGVVTDEIGRCSCGRRQQRRPVPAGGPQQ